MKVTFPQNTGKINGATHEEIVDIVSVEMMRSILLIALEDENVGGGRELLKPPNFAKSSARMFWSLIKAFGPDVSYGLSQLFPQVTDWSWLSDRKRALSDKAQINKQQKKEAADLTASRKRARDLKKNGGIIPEVVEVMVDAHVGQSGSAAVGIGINDPAVAAALKSGDLGIDSLVPTCWVPSLVQYLGSNSVILLAELDFEKPETIKDIKELASKPHPVSTDLTIGTASVSVSGASISEDSLEAWVASAQVHTCLYVCVYIHIK
jgi:hypothetical protein